MRLVRVMLPPSEVLEDGGHRHYSSRRQWMKNFVQEVRAVLHALQMRISQPAVVVNRVSFYLVPFATVS